MNKEKIQDRYLKEYKTIYVDIGDRKCCSLVIPVYYNETLPNDFILRPEILTQIAVLNLTSKNEELQQENKKYKEVIDKMNKLLQQEQDAMTTKISLRHSRFNQHSIRYIKRGVRMNTYSEDKMYESYSSEVERMQKCIDELFNEMSNWREEVKELKKQLEKYENELEKADSITQSCIFNGKKGSEISYRKCLNMLEKHKNQQKEFIEYLKHELNTSYTNSSRFYYFSIILSKYKKIIGDE